MRDATLTVRMSAQEKDLIETYAQMHGVSTSHLLRQTMLERIEDELDLQAYKEAKARWDAGPTGVSLDQMRARLGL